MQSRTILLTGAAGFIGSHTADRLLQRGDRVVGLDNVNDYYSPAQKEQNLKNIGSNGNFAFVRGDVRDKALIERLFSENHFDAVIHLAAMAGVRASVDEPDYYFDVNLIGTLGLLEAARRYGKPNFVFASTSSAYGRSMKIPFTESEAADQPLAPYPASKRSAELLGHSYHHMHGMDFTALRFFTVYGPRNRPDMLPFLVMENIRKKTPLTIYNHGDMHRDWTYVDDIVDGVVAAADRRLGYEVINLGRGEAVLLKSFVQELESLAKSKASWTSKPMPDADVPYTFANIEKARRLLGYDPQISVGEGTRRFFEWYEAQVS